VIHTTTVYVISSNDVVSTYGTVIIPASPVIQQVTDAWFIPSSVVIPPTYQIVYATDVQNCNAPPSIVYDDFSSWSSETAVYVVPSNW
jgi:hypothetical protein